MYLPNCLIVSNVIDIIGFVRLFCLFLVNLDQIINIKHVIKIMISTVFDVYFFSISYL